VVVPGRRRCGCHSAVTHAVPRLARDGSDEGTERRACDTRLGRRRCPSDFRVRVTHIRGDDQEQTMTATTTVDQALTIVRSWLERLIAGSQTRES
jgi:hypothetical protein